MNTALLVIDMQEDLFKKDRLVKHRMELTEHINKLINICRSKNVPIIWIGTQYKDDLSDAPKTFQKKNIRICIKGTPGEKFLSELDKEPTEKVFFKKNYSAFFDTPLDNYLKEHNIDTLIMSGINTHACIRTAAIDAFQLGYEVLIDPTCVDSYDIEHHEISLKYMDNRIATLCDTTKIVEST